MQIRGICKECGEEFFVSGENCDTDESLCEECANWILDMEENIQQLRAEEQQQIEKTIKAGTDARKRLKNYSEEIRAKRDKNLALLKKLKRTVY